MGRGKQLPDFGKGFSVRPGVDNFHQLVLEALHVLVLVDGEFALQRDLGDDAGLGLDLTKGPGQFLAQRRRLGFFLKDEAAQHRRADLRRELVEEAVEE